MDKRTFLRKIDNCIQNMGTPKVYHPRRMKPKWISLTSNQEKMEALENWIMSEKPSIGFKRLVSKGLAEKTLEAVVLSNPQCDKFFKSKEIRKHCIEKFNQFIKGGEYLVSQNLID